MSDPVKLSRRKATRHPEVRWEALSQFCAFAQSTNLTPTQRIAWLAYSYASFVEAAGHYEYFTRTPSSVHNEASAALRMVGAMEQAAVLTAAHEALANAIRLAPGEYSNRYLAGLEFADFEEFDETFNRCHRPVSVCLMDYLDKNESDFIHWEP